MSHKRNKINLAKMKFRILRVGSLNLLKKDKLFIIWHATPNLVNLDTYLLYFVRLISLIVTLHPSYLYILFLK
jgi:hypothetical protein